MASSRLEALREMLNTDPENALVRYGIASELMKIENYEEARAALLKYLSMHEDEGAAYRLLATANLKLGQVDEARAAYRRGMKVALKHNHPSMAAEYEMALDDLNDM